MVATLDSFTFNHADQPDEPNESTYPSSAAWKAALDSRGEQLRNKLNAIINDAQLGNAPYINVKNEPYLASGSDTTTTGGITSGLKTLTVVSASTFSVGHGISVAGAGAAGATLVTTITAINSLVITLADAAGTTVSGAVTKHDDTVALQAAVTYALSVGKTEITVPYGTYNYTTLTGTSGITFVGDGVTFVGTTVLSLTNLGAQLADVTQRSINIMFPPAPLGSVLTDGTDVLGDTTRFQAIVNYALLNQCDVYVPKNLQLEPILQSDGTRVCIKFDDGLASTGNDRKAIKISCKKGVTITTNNTTQAHTIFRWKLGDSILEGFRFKGTKAYTTALEMSRIVLNDITEADATTRNRFSDLRFYTCNESITMEGSAYYNTFDNITFYSSNRCLWLKPTHAMINGLIAVDSHVNRNNFLSLSAFACERGVTLDYGDTNKFYSPSFEGTNVVAVEVYDQRATYPGSFQTIYNTFYGVTNEGNTKNLIYNADGNSFIDFESTYAKVELIKKPLVYIPSGDVANAHLFMQSTVQTNDSDVLAYLKNRSYDTSAWGSYSRNYSDFTNTLDENGHHKLYNWRILNFGASDCVNVSALEFNSSSKKSVYKSLGGIVYYVTKLNIKPVDNTASISLPLPPLTPDNDLYGFGENGYMNIAIGYRKDGGTRIIIPALLSNTSGIWWLNIPVPAGNWSSADTDSSNVLLVNIYYARTISVLDSN